MVNSARNGCVRAPPPPPPSSLKDSCRYAKDGDCDEGGSKAHCKPGTDTTDCSNKRKSPGAAGAMPTGCTTKNFGDCIQRAYQNHCCSGACTQKGYSGCYKCASKNLGGKHCFKSNVALVTNCAKRWCKPKIHLKSKG